MTLPPHDIPAEQAALGSMLLSAAMAEELSKSLVAADFFRPAHAIVFEMILADLRESITPDAVTVHTRLQASGQSELTGGAPYLHGLLEACPLAVNGSVYAGVVRGHAVARRVGEAGIRLLDWVKTRDGDSAALVDRTLKEIQSIRDSGQPGTGPTAKPLYQFLDVPEREDDYKWVIEGVLEAGDRLVITGQEGGGKSELFRQMAVTTAAGLHAFSFTPTRPKRVWLLDRENSERHTRRKLWPLVELATNTGYTIESENLWIDSVPTRMDLARDRDRSWLLSEAAAIRPDIVFLGPLYRLAPHALNDDDDAAPILAALDMLRERDITVVLEAHAGHGTGPGGLRDLRVRGSAAFLGWPEFGIGLRWSDSSTSLLRVVDLVPWRGDRDTGRAWPIALRQGTDWPWTAVYPPGTFTPGGQPFPA